MAQCAGRRWNVVKQRLEPCEDNALWGHGDESFCYRCLKIELGLIESEHQSAQTARPPVRDPLAMLLAEWA